MICLFPAHKKRVISEKNGGEAVFCFRRLQAEDHWEIFARKQGMAPRELYNSYTLGELHEWLRQAEVNKDLAKAREVRELMLEVRIWASQRSQFLGEHDEPTDSNCNICNRISCAPHKL